MSTTPLVELAQRAYLDEEIELYEIDATKLGGEIYRFTPMVGNGADVTWRGNIYSPVPVESSGWEVSGSGTLPTPHITVANVNLAFSSLAVAFGDLLGCPVTRHRTHRRYLDGEVDADPTVEYDPDVYVVNQKVNQNKIFIEWELTPIIDQEGKQIPGRLVLQVACTYIYRIHDGAGGFIYDKFNPCPYAGTSYFKATGAPTTADQDACSKRIDTGCKLRFTVLPTRAFPGAGKTN